ncbi:unnamed protein product [Soboliphyme baturini]|uniref:Glycoprotein n=1 Tax=Soboliphyme baturini TaxID=241478 RepID=A0A183IXX7_9BILA|nr:unnamed protein product [Soboliphyme baturini]
MFHVLLLLLLAFYHTFIDAVSSNDDLLPYHVFTMEVNKTSNTFKARCYYGDTYMTLLHLALKNQRIRTTVDYDQMTPNPVEIERV